MNETEARAYLTKDGNDSVPCSRYGRDTRECALVAWIAASIVARECGEDVTTRDLDYAMSLVVNDADDIAYLLTEYGEGDQS
jgi:hypothetical protein